MKSLLCVKYIVTNKNNEWVEGPVYRNLDKKAKQAEARRREIEKCRKEDEIFELGGSNENRINTFFCQYTILFGGEIFALQIFRKTFSIRMVQIG
jgi:hypothetical protein